MNIFSSQLKSSSGESYKVDLFAESYIGFERDIDGGSGSTFYFDKDWTDFVNTPMSVTIYWDDRANQTTASIDSFTYNSSLDRTEITLNIAYSATYEEMVTALYRPTFEPKILDIKTEWEDQSDIILGSIKSSSTSIVYANNNDWFDRFMDLYLEANDNELKLIIYKDNSGWELEWVGNIVIDLLEWDNISKPRPVTFKAIDGIDKLKDIPYSEVATSPTETRLKEHISNLLQKNDLHQFWGATDAYLRESIEYKSNEVSGTLTSSHSPLDYCYISDRMFMNKEKNSNDEGMSCYDALKGILDLFNCRIFLSKGVYYIQQARNYGGGSIFYREYTKSMGTYTASSYTPLINVGSGLRMLAGGKFNYFAGLYRAGMDVKTNLQSDIKLTTIFTGSSGNPATLNETFDVYGGVGNGAKLNYQMTLSLFGNVAVGDYAYISVQMWGSEGGTTYYLSGGLGAPVQWASVPYSKLHYDFKVSGVAVGSLTKLNITTPEIPFSGTLNLEVNLYHKNYMGVTKSLSGPSYTLGSDILLPLGTGSNNDRIYSENTTTNYTKGLELDPLIITDWSNSTSVNIISVKEDYLTTNNTLTPTLTWDAGFDTDVTLTETRVLEAMSQQFRQIEKYVGNIDGQLYPHNIVGYNNKVYFFNGYEKNYSMDENDGIWIESANKRTGFTPIEYDGWQDSEDETTDWNGQSGMMAIVDNSNKITSVADDISTGDVSIIPIVATGLAATILNGDSIIIVEPKTNEVIETFTATADVSSTDVEISVTTKTLEIDIKEGMIVQLSRATYFQKLNT